MSRDRKERSRPVDADPVPVHTYELDSGGPDLASLVHTNALNICRALAVPCGCQANLPEGLCIASFTPCRFARGRKSGKPYACDDAAPATASGKGKAR